MIKSFISSASAAQEKDFQKSLHQINCEHTAAGWLWDTGKIYENSILKKTSYYSQLETEKKRKINLLAIIVLFCLFPLLKF